MIRIRSDCPITFYAADTAAYERTLLAAADAYPHHSVANNNAASLCLRRGDLAAARHYLLRTRHEPFTWNNQGLLCWLQGKPEEAVVWWQKAKDSDHTARHNLEEVRRRGW